MAKLIIMKGLPASGKSTKAKEIITATGNTVRLNKDLIRTMLHFDKFTGHNEELTKSAAHVMAIDFLKQGVNVIVDDTNLNPRVLEGWETIAEAVGAKIEYFDLTDVSVQECILRDAARDKRVGHHVIERMAMQYLGMLSGQKIVVCDLDGTLCDINHRRHFVKKEPKDWKGFFENMGADTLREDVFDKLVDCAIKKGAKIVFVSARPEDYRTVTEEWLKQNLPKRYLDLLVGALIMRSKGDKRVDTEVKADIYDKFLKGAEIVKVFDDRPSVIRMWLSKGLIVEDVGDGVEF